VGVGTSARARTSRCSSATGTTIRCSSRSRKRPPRQRAIRFRTAAAQHHDGFRVVGARRILQSLGDPMLGYTTIDGRPYYVSQMKNMNTSMPVPFMTGTPFNF
jgi:hypothetical protein